MQWSGQGNQHFCHVTWSLLFLGTLQSLSPSYFEVYSCLVNYTFPPVHTLERTLQLTVFFIHYPASLFCPAAPCLDPADVCALFCRHVYLSLFKTLAVWVQGTGLFTSWWWPSFFLYGNAFWCPHGGEGQGRERERRASSPKVSNPSLPNPRGLLFSTSVTLEVGDSTSR